MNRTDDNKHAPLNGETEVNSAKATDSKPKTVQRRRWVRPVIIAASCVCLGITLMAVTGVAISPFGSGDRKTDADGLYSFSSYRDLDRILRELIEERAPIVYEDVIMRGTPGTLGDAETGDVMLGAGTPAPKGNDAPAHSGTYTQVDGVDEADIVKTDGNYIYYASYMENQVIIAKAENGKTERLSSIREKGDSLIRDIYVNGDSLIVVSETEVRTHSSGNDAPFSRKGNDDTVSSVAVTSYDITDRSKPDRIGHFAQSGYLLSSRMSDGKLILVTDQNLYSADDDNRYPMRAFEDEALQTLDIDDIKCIPDTASASYAVVSLIDPSRGKMSADTAKTIAVLGGSDQIYCSTDELYITSTTYERQDDGGFFRHFKDEDIEPIDPETSVLKIKFSDDKISFSALGSVPGSVNDQFSMDAKDGYFRIATTSIKKGEDVNNLFILDEKLREVGSVRNFARDEHIEAVRYIGDLAYVITYEETDPLFIIDLADPADPKIRGHVKISGFSTLLVPTDDTHILGFGFSTENTEFGEATDGLKLALFDVSDPDGPKVADSMSFAGTSSEIQYDHKALLAGPDGSYYAIPYDRSPNGGLPPTGLILPDEPAPEARPKDKDESGIMVFNVRSGKIELVKDFASDVTIRRCLYIGDWIYGICGDDSIKAYKL